jgi:rhodanese-related sulfurtransferase
MTTTHRAVITAPELHELLLNHPVPPRLIDVRTPGEHATSHVAGSHNVPLDVLREHRDQLGELLDTDVVLICRSGQRAAQAESTLRAAGLHNLRVLDGGMTAWVGAELAVINGAERWDLERQVRLVAGSLVASAVLGSNAAPKLKWLAGAVGGGLAYAALSNTCAMGMLLAKLPYNRGPARDPDSIIAALIEGTARRTAV